jgi:hypothetical protein
LKAQTPHYKVSSKEEVFGFGHESNKADSQMGGVSWGGDEKSVVLEELGES